MTPYEVLNVPITADQEAIKKAYRTLIKKYHPDINKDRDASIITQQIIEAYTAIIGIDNVVSKNSESSTFYIDKYICEECNGTGHQNKTVCDDCFGFGIIKTKNKQMFVNAKCPTCKGNGYPPPPTCLKCNGFGVVKG